MKLSEIKDALEQMTLTRFVLPDGQSVPAHFHVTEIGMIQKRYIDCGGTLRSEDKITFQLWTAEDYDHRLGAEKLLKIIRLAEKSLDLPDAEVELEYQQSTKSVYGLALEGSSFQLVNTFTDCLAKDNCGVPESKTKLSLNSLGNSSAGCAPGSGCC